MKKWALVFMILAQTFCQSLSAEERSIFDMKKVMADQGIVVKGIDLVWKNSTSVYDMKGYKITFSDGTALEVTRVSPALLEDITLLYKRTVDNDILKIYGCPNFLHKKDFHSLIGAKTDNDREYADQFVKRLKENFDDLQRQNMERNGGFYLKKKDIVKKEYLDLGLEAMRELEHSYKPTAALRAKILENARKTLESSEYKALCDQAAEYNRHIPSAAMMEKILKVFSLW